MNYPPNILASVTAYQDEQAVQKCLEAVVRQTLPISYILLVDNSPLPRGLSFQVSGLEFVHYPENVGVGGGVAFAVQSAITRCCDFLWLLDQDSEPAEDCLEQLVQVYQEQCKLGLSVALVAPRVKDKVMNRGIGGAVFDRYRFKEQTPAWSEDLSMECDAPIVSGTLVAIAAAKTVAPPREDLFMDGVDLEYGLRLTRAGFHNLITAKASLYHHLGSPLKVGFLGKSYFIRNYSISRTYYYYRNHTYLEISSAKAHYKLWALLHRCKAMLKDILLTLMYRDQKRLRVHICILGTWDGIYGRLGKRENLPE
jgi:rhamnosyltransferase